MQVLGSYPCPCPTLLWQAVHKQKSFLLGSFLISLSARFLDCFSDLSSVHEHCNVLHPPQWQERKSIKTRVKKERKWSFISAFCSRPCPATLSAGRGPSFTNGWQKSSTVKCNENAGHLTQASMATNDHRLVPILKRYLSFKTQKSKI